MELGAFSISLAVKDILASKAFYEKLDFRVFAGEISQNWLILKNGEHAIGLFQGMFERKMLTFNPGWDGNARKLDTFMDVREIQKRLKMQGVEFLSEADEKTTGPASVITRSTDRSSPVSRRCGRKTSGLKDRPGGILLKIGRDSVGTAIRSSPILCSSIPAGAIIGSNPSPLL